ncbi:hypothetical protein K440DRAFT_643922 [Wilcoxina mikolae CBS 423.85]|nr:hypothetical protein K440DRAFT_643922 [Wilcoxina mikolae CBS 423.85]
MPPYTLLLLLFLLSLLLLTATAISPSHTSTPTPSSSAIPPPITGPGTGYGKYNPWQMMGAFLLCLMMIALVIMVNVTVGYYHRNDLRWEDQLVDLELQPLAPGRLAYATDQLGDEGIEMSELQLPECTCGGMSVEVELPPPVGNLPECTCGGVTLPPPVARVGREMDSDWVVERAREWECEGDGGSEGSESSQSVMDGEKREETQYEDALSSNRPVELSDEKIWKREQREEIYDEIVGEIVLPRQVTSKMNLLELTLILILFAEFFKFSNLGFVNAAPITGSTTHDKSNATHLWIPVVIMGVVAGIMACILAKKMKLFLEEMPPPRPHEHPHRISISQPFNLRPLTNLGGEVVGESVGVVGGGMNVGDDTAAAAAAVEAEEKEREKEKEAKGKEKEKPEESAENNTKEEEEGGEEN